MPKTAFQLNLKRPPEDAAVKTHNRWHPDIAPVLSIGDGDVVELDMRDALDGQIRPGMTGADLGTISLDGEDITDLPMYRRARLGIGYLPQEASIFRGLSVEHNIRAVL